jgi:hypothetical protein
MKYAGIAFGAFMACTAMAHAQNNTIILDVQPEHTAPERGHMTDDRGDSGSRDIIVTDRMVYNLPSDTIQRGMPTNEIPGFIGDGNGNVILRDNYDKHFDCGWTGFNCPPRLST